MYHVNKQGLTGKCNAKKDNCPFGSINEHFNSPAEARSFYEKKMSAQNGGISSLRKNASTAPLLSPKIHDTVYNNSERSIEYSPQQAKEKFDKEIAGHSYSLTQENNPGEPGIILERLFGIEPDSDPVADLGTTELKTLSTKRLNQHISLGSLKLNGNIMLLKHKFLGKKFTNTLGANEWSQVGDHYYTLFVDRKQKKVRVIIANKAKEFVSTDDFSWNFDDLEKKVDDKLRHIAVGIYDSDQQNKTVTFKELVIGGFTRKSMIDKIESGEVKVNFRFEGSYRRTTLVSKLDDFKE